MTSAASGAAPVGGSGHRVGVIVSRFPTVSETFIARELRQMEDLGLDFTIYSLVDPAEAFVQEDSASLMPRVTYGRIASVETLRANLHWMRHRPARYLSTWVQAVWGNRDSLKMLSRAVAALPIAGAFACRMEADGTESVHGHWLTHSGFAAWAVHRLTGLPYTLTGHAHDVYEQHAFMSAKCRDATAIAVCVGHSAKVLGERYGSDVQTKTTVVRHGVDLERFAVRDLRPPDDEVRVVCVASFVPFKGHSVLLDALTVLRSRGVRVRCRLVGDGRLRAEIEAAIAEKGLGDVVELTGALPGDLVRDQMEWADLVVHAGVELESGRKDGVPNVLVEAMALGRPVVASDLPGISELVDHERTGFLVAQRDPVALADAIERATSDPEVILEMVAAARKTVEAEYDVRQNAEELLAVTTGHLEPPTLGAAHSAALLGSRTRN